MSRAREIRVRRMKERIMMLVIGILIGLLLFQAFAIKTSANNRPERYKYYTSVFVKPGDTLWTIAQDYITDDYDNMEAYISEVMRMNHLGEAYVQAGNYICVPYYSEQLIH